MKSDDWHALKVKHPAAIVINNRTRDPAGNILMASLLQAKKSHSQVCSPSNLQLPFLYLRFMQGLP
jgi:hypothetical protein